jgi:hypothetical protein
VASRGGADTLSRLSLYITGVVHNEGRGVEGAIPVRNQLHEGIARVRQNAAAQGREAKVAGLNIF